MKRHLLCTIKGIEYFRYRKRNEDWSLPPVFYSQSRKKRDQLGHGLEDKQDWVQWSALLLTSWVALGRELNLFDLLISYLLKPH